MRNTHVVALAHVGLLMPLLLSSTEVSAKTVTISGTHGAGEIQQKCDAAGGVFQGGLKGNGYGCTNFDSGVVLTCTNKGKCNATVPAAIKPGGILSKLPITGAPTANSMGGGTSASGGPKPLSGGTTATPPPSALTNPSLLGATSGTGPAATGSKTKLPASGGAMGR